MKKYKLYLLLAALVGLTASCSRDAEESGLQTTDNSTVSIGASIDPGVSTRAGSGDAYTMPDGRKLRYILEVWSTGADAAVIHREEQTATDLAGVNFNFKLEQTGKYQALLWADFILTATESSQTTIGSVTYDHYSDKFYTTTNGLKQIAHKTFFHSNETADAFFACLDIEKTAGAYNKPVTLNRPFGQVNIIEKDATLADKVTAVRVTYNAPGTFDVSTGTPGAMEECGNYIHYNRPTPSDACKANIAYIYVFAPAEGQTLMGGITLGFTTAPTSGISFPDFTIPANMPVERNRRTNISGHILSETAVPSTDASLSVSLSTGWETNDEAKDVDDLVWNGQYPTSEAEAKEWLGPETSGAESTVAAEHVFTITAARQLAAMHYLWANDKINLSGTEKNYAYASYNLAADINLNGKPWKPMGFEDGLAHTFYGIFNGQGHTIYGMNVSGTWSSAGFISNCNNGIVKNLNVKGNIDVTYTSLYPAGYGFYGGIVGNISLGSQIAFCSFQGSIRANVTSGNCAAGGIIGSGTGYSSNPVQIISSYSVLTEIEPSSSSFACKGGIAGYLQGGVTFKCCYWQEVAGLGNTNPYGSAASQSSNNIVEDCGHFANAAAMDDAVIAAMNAAATDNDYQWQADPAGGYPVLVKKTQP